MEKYGANFITSTGTSDGAHLKDMKLVGFYFGAKYCKPANEFNQILVNFYNEINKEEKVFEIVYFGFDQKQIEFQETLKEMPWLAYDFKDANKIKTYFEFKQDIPGIPALLILHPQNGKLVTKSGRGNVQTAVYSQEVFDKWLEIKDMK